MLYSRVLCYFNILTSTLRWHIFLNVMSRRNYAIRCIHYHALCHPCVLETSSTPYIGQCMEGTTTRFDAKCYVPC